jgi:hypothetical protein
MDSDCQRCGGTGHIRIPTIDPCNDALHWCPDCAHLYRGRLLPDGEWSRTPFWYTRHPDLLHSRVEQCLMFGEPLVHPRTGKVVRDTWWLELCALRDRLWGWTSDATGKRRT